MQGKSPAVKTPKKQKDADPESLILELAIKLSNPEFQKRLEKLNKSIEQQTKPEQKRVRDTASKLKRLTVPQVEALLAKVIAKQGYRKFSLGELVMGREVTAEFTTQDGNEAREPYDSRIELKRLIEQALADTCWKLMSEGIHERLGVLSGRLRAIEDEEELVKLVESRQKQKATRAQPSPGKSS